MSNNPKNSYLNSPGFISSNGTVLVVDDEPVVRAMTSAVLTAMGWNILNASSGEEAITKLQHFMEGGSKLDLVILDLILPCGMSGLEVVQALREVQPDLRILACSGFFGDDGGESCIAMGFNAALAKPFTAEDLSQAVYRCTHESELPMEKSPA